MRYLKIFFRFAVMIAAACAVILFSNMVNRPGLRDFPYPYSAMLSIQSHIDGCTEEEFRIIHDFLNTENWSDKYGKGVGLDVGDSMWMYLYNDGVAYREEDSMEPGDYMSWFRGHTFEKNSADLIKAYWDMDYIDSIHTVGDFSMTGGKVVFFRELAKIAYEQMNERGIYPAVWINHGTETNVQNLGGYSPFGFTRYQSGDKKGSEYYHADLMRKAGIKFIWNSICDSRFGMKNPLFPILLRDGQTFWGFKSYTGYPTKGGYKYQWSPLDLADVLKESNLDKIIENREFSIIATHLGSADNMWAIMNDSNLRAFRTLKAYQNEGKILVARSSKLLRYCQMRNFVSFEKQGNDINITGIRDPIIRGITLTSNMLRGLTFYVDDSSAATLSLYGERVPEESIQRNPPDETGKESIAFVW